MNILNLYDRFYVKMLIGAATQALFASVMATLGLLVLNSKGQFISTVVFLIMIVIVTRYTDKFWFIGLGAASQSFLTATISFLGIMNPSALQQLAFGLIYLIIVYLLFLSTMDTNNKTTSALVTPVIQNDSSVCCGHCGTRSETNIGTCKQCGAMLPKE